MKRDHKMTTYSLRVLFISSSVASPANDFCMRCHRGQVSPAIRGECLFTGRLTFGTSCVRNDSLSPRRTIPLLPLRCLGFVCEFQNYFCDQTVLSFLGLSKVFFACRTIPVPDDVLALVSCLVREAKVKLDHKPHVGTP